MGKNLLVRKIRDGTVIDHIRVGYALVVLDILGIKGDKRIAVIMNTDSGKYGRKDIVKIEGYEVDVDEANLISLISPEATINIIKDYRVVSKRKVDVPEYVEGIVKCSNPNCISNSEGETAIPKFKVVSKDPLLLRCQYCERYTTREDIIRSLSPGRFR